VKYFHSSRLKRIINLHFKTAQELQVMIQCSRPSI